MVKVYNILLLEDDLHSANVVIRILEKYNFEIVHCDNVRNGLLKVKEIKFDLIISDIMMPAMDGFSFLSKANKDIKDIPIIMLTAVKEKETVLKAVHSKVFAYIIKPFQKVDLLGKISEALQVRYENFILRKDFPLTILPTVTGGILLELVISGIPTKVQLDEFEGVIKIIKSKNGGVETINFTINEEFGYYANHIENVEILVTKLCKNFKIPAKAIYLKGSYFQGFSFSHLDVNSILKECMH